VGETSFRAPLAAAQSHRQASHITQFEVQATYKEDLTELFDKLAHALH